MTLRRLFRAALILGGPCSLLCPDAAVGQTSSRSRKEINADQLEHIIVTARRREEELQKTPISVISLSADALEKRSITNVAALQNFVPNLTFAPSQNVGDAAGNMFIRGIGQEDFVAGAEPGVGFYLDGVYVARTMGNLINLIDVQRIEVLRGPQGTLYGRNTIGGAISLMSAPPTAERAATADLIVGNIGRLELRGIVNAPLTDTFFARVAASRVSRAGYLNRLPPPFPPTGVVEMNRDPEGRDESNAGRLQLRWLASPSLTVDIATDASRRRGSQSATHVDAIDPRFGILPAVNGLIVAGRLPGPSISDDLVTDDWLTSYAGGFNSIAQNIDGLAVTVTKDIRPKTTLKLITSHRRLRSHVATDLDGTWFAILQSDFRERHRQYTVELQASGKLWGLTYTAGLFGLAERMHTSSGRGISRADVLYLCGCFYVPGRRPVLSYTRRAQSGDSHAVYAQADMPLTRRLFATMGGRLSTEHKSTDVELVQLDPDTLEPTNRILRSGSNRGRWRSFTWRAGLTFQASPDLMLYWSAAKGYKSGGFNTRPVFNLPNLGINTFAPETALTYEAGVRSEWLKRRVQLNATVFHTSYEDIQLRQTTFVDGILTTIIENAARARIRGLEVEATAKLSQRLGAQIAYGYLNPRYLDVGRVPGLTLDTVFQRTPHHSFSASIDYAIPLGRGSLSFHGDYSYRSREQLQLLASRFDQHRYGLLGARLTFKGPNGRWSAALFGTNLSDKRYRVAGRDGLTEVGIANSVIGLPRQVGIELKAGF